jgi:hypothetical protein
MNQGIAGLATLEPKILDLVIFNHVRFVHIGRAS